MSDEREPEVRCERCGRRQYQPVARRWVCPTCRTVNE